MTELDDVSLCFPSFCFDTLGLILIRCDGLDKYDIILVYYHEVDGIVWEITGSRILSPSRSLTWATFWACSL